MHGNRAEIVGTGRWHAVPAESPRDPRTVSPCFVAAQGIGLLNGRERPHETMF